MKDAAKKFRKTCEKCNKPFSTANESEVLCRECRMRDDFAKRRAEDEARKEADAKSNEVFETRKCVALWTKDVQISWGDDVYGTAYDAQRQIPANDFLAFV